MGVRLRGWFAIRYVNIVGPGRGSELWILYFGMGGSVWG